MKNEILYKIVIILLAVCIMVCFYKLKYNSTNFDRKDLVISNIINRKSIRAYTSQKIEKDVLEDIIRAGMAAPTGGNMQPWEFVVVTNHNILDKLSTVHPHVAMAKGAPAAIIVAGDIDVYKGDKEWLKPFWVQDTSAATQNILLAVEAYGLGAVWTGVYPIADYAEKTQKLLNMPKNIIPLNIIVLGYSDENVLPKNKFKPAKLHWEMFNKQGK